VRATEGLSDEMALLREEQLRAGECWCGNTEFMEYGSGSWSEGGCKERRGDVEPSGSMWWVIYLFRLERVEARVIREDISLYISPAVWYYGAVEEHRAGPFRHYCVSLLVAAVEAVPGGPLDKAKLQSVVPSTQGADRIRVVDGPASGLWDDEAVLSLVRWTQWCVSFVGAVHSVERWYGPRGGETPTIGVFGDGEIAAVLRRQWGEQVEPYVVPRGEGVLSVGGSIRGCSSGTGVVPVRGRGLFTYREDGYAEGEDIGIEVLSG
jgi:hypothetical protein